MTATCAACSAPITWAETTRGKRMPVDRDPVDGGNLRLTARPKGPPLVEVISAGDLFTPDEPRFVPHFATCPHAQAFRSFHKDLESRGQS